MAESSSIQSVLRSLIRTPDEKFQTYNRYGKILPGVEWLPLSGGAEAGKEVYLIRFGPGSRSHPHIHRGSEEFLVLDGELTDHDGMVFQTGDFVRFEPDSEHWSISEKGCTLLVILAGGTNQPIPETGSNLVE
jgi:anti-sigma factor ChrR (cupin superfamily)